MVTIPEITEPEQRAAIVAEAESWLGTPYQHAQQVKGSGCDCATLMAGVYGNTHHADVRLGNYPSQWSLHNSDSIYLAEIVKYAHEITESEVKPGDIVVYLLARTRTWGHGAIILSWPDRVIHAVWNRSVEYAHGTKDANLRQGQRRFFSLFGRSEP